MNMIRRGAVILGLLAAGGCANMSEQDRNTAIGAAVGGVAGSALTDSAAGTVGGAVVGGVIGNRVKKPR